MKLRFNYITKSYHIKFFSCLFMIMIFFSCDYVDIGGLVSAQHNVEQRMAELDQLPETTFDLTIDTNNFSFLFITDCHYYKENFGYLKKISLDDRFKDVSFIIINGDNVQSGQQYQYDYLLQDIKDSGKKVYAVLGNHDIYNGGYELFKKYFGRASYVLHIGKTNLFVLDTANCVIGSSQRKWIENQLQQSSAKNKVIMTHASPFDESAPEIMGACSFAYQDDVNFIVSICDKYKVNYFLSGHLHQYGECTVRGTRYIKLYQQAKPDHKYAKLTVKDGNISIEIY